MAIKIERDEEYNNNPRRRVPNNGGGGSNTGGGGGGIFALLPILFSLFGKNPKMLLILALLAGAYFFFGKGCSSDMLSDTDNQNSLSTGLSMSESEYRKIEIYEPLADNKRNPMPERVSLLKHAPDRMNQGRQGSCVGWATSYAARTILHSRQTGENPNKTPFSPAHLYNRIALQGCQGAYLTNAMKTLKQEGVVPFQYFKYDESSCSQKAPQDVAQYAQNFTIPGYNRLTGSSTIASANNLSVNMLGMKQNLAAGAPVVIGMMVGGSFMRGMEGQEKWLPQQSDYSMPGYGGHAMCVIGYDDYKFGNEGGFEIMNSWGPEWGKNGVGWVSYQDFEHFTKEAWGMYPMGNADAKNANVLNVRFGLVDKKTDRNIPVQKTSNNVFSTRMNKGQRFKLEVTNDVACYVYVLAEDPAPNATLLFPYTKKHSPYCGVTGTRLFPRDHSLYPDEVGNLDRFAIVVSKTPIDYDVMKGKINASSASTFKGKIETALSSELISNANFSQVGTSHAGLTASVGGKNASVMFFEVAK